MSNSDQSSQLCLLLPLGCPQDWFGKGCELKCACRNGGLCHATNGSCSCPLGWMGPHCEHGECMCMGRRNQNVHLDIEQGRALFWTLRRRQSLGAWEAL